MRARQESVPCVLPGWLKLLLLSTVILVVWLVILPGIARLTPARQHIQRMERQGIVVDAMFYTELNWKAPSGAVFHADRGEPSVPNSSTP